MLEGMSLKNNRDRLIQQIEENEPTVNPKITLCTLEKYLQLFKDQFESTQKNVLNSIGKLPINEEQILTLKYPRKRAFAMKRDLSKVTVSSKTNTMDRQLELEEYEHTVVEEKKAEYNNRLQQIIKQARQKGNKSALNIIKPFSNKNMGNKSDEKKNEGSKKIS